MHIIRLRWVCVISCSPLGVINIRLSRPYFALFRPFLPFLMPRPWILRCTCTFMRIIRLRWVCIISCSPLGVINICVISSRLGGRHGISRQVLVLRLWNVRCTCTYTCIIRLRWVIVINCCLLGVINIRVISSRLGGRLGISRQVHVLRFWNLRCTCTYMCIIRLVWVFVIDYSLLEVINIRVILARLGGRLGIFLQLPASQLWDLQSNCTYVYSVECDQKVHLKYIQTHQKQMWMWANQTKKVNFLSTTSTLPAYKHHVRPACYLDTTFWA
jgi:hypothetical protein